MRTHLSSLECQYKRLLYVFVEESDPPKNKQECYQYHTIYLILTRSTTYKALMPYVSTCLKRHATVNPLKQKIFRTCNDNYLFRNGWTFQIAHSLTLLLILLCATLHPQVLKAQEDTTFTLNNEQGYPIKYAVTDNTEHTVAVTGFPYTGNHARINLRIPKAVYHNGTNYTVTSIGERAFYFCTNIYTMELPSTLTSIGDQSFSLSSITTIDIPQNIKEILAGAFSDSHLKTIKLHEGIETIERGAFSICRNLTSINLPSSIKKNWFGCVFQL